MKVTTKFIGHSVGGSFVPSDSDGLYRHMKALEGEKVVATVKKFKKMTERSNNQNRYYHGVVCKILSDELGYTPEEIHEILKCQFLAKPIELRKTNVLHVTSTASLSTVEFEDLMSKVRAWSSRELSIFIPEPNAVPFEY